MHYLLQKTFENRKYTSEFLQEMENSHYKNLHNIEVLADKLHELKENKKHITIMPDFDSDGINSGIVGFAGLSELGFNVSLFIPNPKEGYEITPETIDRMLAEHPTTDAILTCDVGITCFQGIDYAKSKGITVLVTDHHMEKERPVGLQPADCIVDPMCEADDYEHPRICGAFVLYQCLQYYANIYCDQFMQEQIKRLRVFAGIGTVSDVMPILYENRHLVREAIGIAKMVYFGGDDYMVSCIQGCEVYRRAFYGLHILIKAFADAGKLKSPSHIDEEFFGYYLAPALNSVKRMDKDMKLAFGVFFGPDFEENARALVALNEERKELVKKHSAILEETKSTQQYAPYIYFSEAPSGILGLLAMEIMNKTGMPAMVVKQEENGKIHGSGRSPKWYKFLTNTIPHGFSPAGHNPAFGIKFTDLDEVNKMKEFLQTDATDIYEKGVADGTISTETTYDFVIAQDGTGDVTLDVVTFAEYIAELKYYRPFGEEFEAPNILLKYNLASINKDEDIKIIGTENQHLKIVIDYGIEVLLWNQADKIDMVTEANNLLVSGHLEESVFMGKHRISFIGTIVEE